MWDMRKAVSAPLLPSTLDKKALFCINIILVQASGTVKDGSSQALVEKVACSGTVFCIHFDGWKLLAGTSGQLIR